MRFAACLKKDIRLLTGGGLRSLLFFALPVLLVFLMLLGMGDAASADVNIQSFDIAVRDLDGTIMSRMLTTQLDGVGLFSRVIRAGSATDEELLDSGCAAIVTIPKDMFYDLYDMKDIDVVIALNASMPAEAAMVRSAFTSLVGILEENQRLYYAAARARYGDLDDAAMREVYHDYSNASVEELLGRLGYFGFGSLFSRQYDEKKLFFASGLLSMLLMFIPLAVNRSVSDELDAGLSTRFAIAGGSLFESMASKLLIAAVMTLVPCLIVCRLLVPGLEGKLLPIMCSMLLLSFCFFMFVGFVSGRAETAQLAGNVIMLLMLTLGGAFFPQALLPGALRKVAPYTLPGLLLRAMQGSFLGKSTVSAAGWLLIPAAAFFLMSLPFFGKRRRA